MYIIQGTNHTHVVKLCMTLTDMTGESDGIILFKVPLVGVSRALPLRGGVSTLAPGWGLVGIVRIVTELSCQGLRLG